MKRYEMFDWEIKEIVWYCYDTIGNTFPYMEQIGQSILCEHFSCIMEILLFIISTNWINNIQLDLR